MYSYYKFFTEIALAEGLSFSKIQTCEERQKSNGYPFYIGGYAEQLKLFLQYFRRDQILILSDEELFRDHHKAMNSIQKFLGLNWNYWWYRHPFPHDDHWGHPRFKGKIQCCKDYVPQLGCQFRNATALRFKGYNEDLLKLVNVTTKNRFEPLFKGFGDLAYKVACVNSDPREVYSKKIANGKRIQC
jgi:hypothetical protein